MQKIVHLQNIADFGSNLKNLQVDVDDLKTFKEATKDQLADLSSSLSVEKVGSYKTYTIASSILKLISGEDFKKEMEKNSSWKKNTLQKFFFLLKLRLSFLHLNELFGCRNIWEGSCTGSNFLLCGEKIILK